MMRTFFHSMLLALSGIAMVHAADAPVTPKPVPGPGPQALIEQVSKDLLRDLDANREKYRKDPAQLRALVDRFLLPNFDTEFAARRVLGKHWTSATPEQRKRFIDAFVGSLMGDYSEAILEFTSDRLQLLPFRGDPAAPSATVRSLVKRSNGTEVPVNYTLRATPGGWKAWDLTVGGISYVRNFQNDFATEINEQGLEHLIQRLEAQRGAHAPASKTG